MLSNRNTMQAIYVTSNFQVAASSGTGEFNSESFYLNQYLQNIDT